MAFYRGKQLLPVPNLLSNISQFKYFESHFHFEKASFKTTAPIILALPPILL